MGTALLFRSLLALSVVSMMTACAGLKSQQADQDRVSGVAYYMPKRAFMLTVTTVVGEIKELKWEVSPAMPDLTKTYSLRYHPHWIGKTTIDVAVGPNGLLGVANTATTDSATELKKIVAAASTAKTRTLKADEACPRNASFTFYFFEPAEGTRCSGLVEFRIEPVPLDSAGKAPASGHKNSPRQIESNESRQGIFYRQDRPYILTAWSPRDAALTTSLLSAPNQSPTMFLPYGRTLFAANDGKVTFNEGVLSTYKQDDDGELVALLKFPAAILGAYFIAIGNVFSAFSAKDADDYNLKIKEVKLGILREKLAKCVAALETNDKPALEALDCANLSAFP